MEGALNTGRTKGLSASVISPVPRYNNGTWELAPTITSESISPALGAAMRVC